MNLEETEHKAIVEARALFGKLSAEAKLEFLKAESWAELHIGNAVLFGALAGAALTILFQVTFGL